MSSRVLNRWPPHDRARPWRACVVALSLLLIPECTGYDQGVDYAQLHLHTTRDDGTSVPGAAAAYCAVLPVLNGSRVRERIPVEGSVEIRTDATNDEITLEFAGTSTPRRVIPAEILQDTFTETLSLVAANGTTYSLTLSSSCK